MAGADELRAWSSANGVRSVVLPGAMSSAEKMEVLVAAGVAQVQQRAGLVRPEVIADAARVVAGDRAAFAGLSTGATQTFITPSTGASQLRVLPSGLISTGALGVAEQRIARDQFDLRSCAAVLVLGRAGWKGK